MRCPKCECLNLDEGGTCYNCGSPLDQVQNPIATSPPALEGEPKRGFRGVWLLWGCGGLVAASLLLLGSCFLVVKGGMAASERQFGPAVESYLAKVHAGDFRSCYRDFGQAMHDAVKEEDYLALEAGFQEKLGPLKSKKAQSFQSGVDVKGRWGRIVYACEFEHGKGTLTFSLRKTGDTWEIIELRYDSPVFLEYLKAKPTP